MTKGAEETKYDMELEAHQNVLYHISIVPGYKDWVRVFGENFTQQYTIAFSLCTETDPDVFMFVTNKDGVFGFTHSIEPYIIADSDIQFIDSAMGRWGDIWTGMYASLKGVQPKEVRMHLMAINLIPTKEERPVPKKKRSNK